MAISNTTILDVLRPIVGEAETYQHHNQTSFLIKREDLVEVMRELRDNPLTRFEQLLDVTAIDWLDTRKERFEVVYFLYSITHKDRTRIKVSLSQKDPRIDSVTDIWEGANWYERETFDMYGVVFEGHPDLRRFYMPEDYVDPETREPLYPLRKDYPLMGIPGAAIMPDFIEKNDWKQKKDEYLRKFPSDPLKDSHSMHSPTS